MSTQFLLNLTFPIVRIDKSPVPTGLACSESRVQVSKSGETYRAEESISEGRKCAEFAIHNIRRYLDYMGYKPQPTESAELTTSTGSSETTSEQTS